MPVRDPYLDEGMRGWIISTAKKNYWRVAAYYDLDDLIQDGYLCYAKCHARYTHLTVKRHPLKDDKRRFMALVQAAFTNHITTLAWKRSRLPEQNFSATAHVLGVPDEGALLEDLLSPQQEQATVSLLLSTAPKEIKRLFELLVEDAVSLGGYLRMRRQGQRSRQRETNNEYFCRLLGLNPAEIDLIGLVDRHFLVN